MSQAPLIEPVPFEPRPLRVARTPRPPRRPFPRPALAGLLVLGLGVLLLASIRAVEIQVEPPPDRLAVSGWPHLKVGALRLMLPGRYALRAEKARFLPLEASFEVTRDPRQIARFALELRPGLLAIAATPAEGVRVEVDGTERGVTPVAPLELPPGDHEVRLRAEGYASFATRVTLAGGGDTETLTAVLRPDRAAVTIGSEPPGATVRVDGAEIGRTPFTAELTSGARRVEVSLPGYAPASRTITVVAEQPLTVPLFRLEPLPGRLRLTSEPPAAAVSVAGRFRGETPFELEVPAGGPYVVRATRAGHEAAEATITLARGEILPLHLQLVAQRGEVQVVVEPADAEVLVDGQPRPAGATFELSAAPHELEVRRAGHEPQRLTVTPRPGFPQTVRVRLRSLKETQAAARPSVLRTPSGHELRLLSGGRFQMGASRREPGRRANETQREVELVRPYYLSVREVTNAQFRRFKPEHSSGRFGAYELDADTHPVVQVTWEQAASYCNWLSAQEGLAPAYLVREGKPTPASPLTTGYRLPTEAEWSRAARYPEGTGPLKFSWGPSLPAPPKAGNFADESARPLVPVVLQGYEDRYPVSAPVGSFPPNALGIFDLGGNAAEWVHDVYSIPPPDVPLERDPQGPASGELHVILGSSFLQGSVSELRLAYRDYGTKPRADVGFRLARYAE